MLRTPVDGDGRDEKYSLRAMEWGDLYHEPNH